MISHVVKAKLCQLDIPLQRKRFILEWHDCKKAVVPLSYNWTHVKQRCGNDTLQSMSTLWGLSALCTMPCLFMNSRPSRTSWAICSTLSGLKNTHKHFSESDDEWLRVKKHDLIYLHFQASTTTLQARPRPVDGKVKALKHSTSLPMMYNINRLKFNNN